MRERENGLFKERFSLKRPVFPFSREKDRISQGVENRGSLISVPLALRGTSRNNQGFPKGGFCEGGKISIIGVVRAPVAIINFASNPCENL